MQQTSSSARPHLAMGQLNSIGQRCVKAPVNGDMAEISLWRGDLLIEEVLNVTIRPQFPRTTSMLRSCSPCR